MLRSLFREPLVHFVLAAAAIFILFEAVGGAREDKGKEIIVSGAQVSRIAALWRRARNRPPTPDELKGLVDDFIKEEIYYRTARALALDVNDTVVRRRLRQKMEFLHAGISNPAEPTDEQLTAYIERHSERYRTSPSLAFRQIYLRPTSQSEKLLERASSILGRLGREGRAVDISVLGDVTQLPAEMPLTSIREIATTFGPRFAHELQTLEPGRWHGPLRSTYGYHIIFISQREPGGQPALNDVRQAVTRDWMAEQRQRNWDVQFERLRQAYTVRIEWPDTVRRISELEQ